MSDIGYDDAGWAQPSPLPGTIVHDAFRKEQLLKEIASAQEDLRVLLNRTQQVQGEVDKLTSDNATLQMYIDNLTLQMAKRR